MFYSATDPNEISDTLRHYIAGQVASPPFSLVFVFVLVRAYSG